MEGLRNQKRMWLVSGICATLVLIAVGAAIWLGMRSSSKQLQEARFVSTNVADRAGVTEVWL